MQRDSPESLWASSCHDSIRNIVANRKSYKSGGRFSYAPTTDRSNTWSISWSWFSVTSTVPLPLSLSLCLPLPLFRLREFTVPLCPTRSNASTTFTFNRRIPRGDSIIYTLESEFNLHDVLETRHASPFSKNSRSSFPRSLLARADFIISMSLKTRSSRRALWSAKRSSKKDQRGSFKLDKDLKIVDLPTSEHSTHVANPVAFSQESWNANPAKVLAR